MKITSYHTILTFEISITKSNCDMVFLPMNHCAIYRYRKTVFGFEYNIIYKFEIFTKRFYHIISGSFFLCSLLREIFRKNRWFSLKNKNIPISRQKNTEWESIARRYTSPSNPIFPFKKIKSQNETFLKVEITLKFKMIWFYKIYYWLISFKCDDVSEVSVK